MLEVEDNLISCLHESLEDGKLGVDQVILHYISGHRFQLILVILIAIDAHISRDVHAMSVKAKRED